MWIIVIWLCLWVWAIGVVRMKYWSLVVIAKGVFFVGRIVLELVALLWVGRIRLRIICIMVIFRVDGIILIRVVLIVGTLRAVLIIDVLYRVLGKYKLKL